METRLGGSYLVSNAASFHEPTIEVRSPRPHAALVVLGGEHDLNSAGDLRLILDRTLPLCDHLIVDLSAAEFIDSTTVRVLLEANRHATERDREFSVVLGTEAVVERMLEVSGVLSILNVVPTVERALDA
jgi:anti-anti-sigma factor